MTRFGFAALWCAALVLTAVAGGATNATAATPAHALIQGSGSSWAANAIEQWIADESGAGLQVSYTPDGSAAGRQDFANKVDDFAVSDLPYQGTDPATGADDSSNGRDFTYVPLTAGATTFAYHLEAHGRRITDLRLSGATLAGIFTGTIKYWDASRIENDNRHRIALPHLRITPVVHSEGSAVSNQFASYLATQYPTQWQAFTSPTTAPSPYWPVNDAGARAEAGSNGVMNYIASAAGNGSIGYDEYSYAVQQQLPVVALRNRAGYFVDPSADDVAVALERVTTNPDGSADLDSVYTSPDRRAYPLSSYSYAVVPTAPDDATMTTAKRNTLAAFLGYALCEGQQNVITDGYAPLPLNLVHDGFDGMTAADPAAAPPPSVENCHNPTFLDGSPPTDYLRTHAPYPSACASAAHGPCGVPRDTSSLRAAAGSTSAHRGVRRTLVTRLLDRVTGNGVGRAAVTLWRRSGRTRSWARVASGHTASNGWWRATVHPSRTTTYQSRYAGDPDHLATTSSDTVVRVR